MGQFATRLSIVEGHPPPAGTLPYGLPGYDGIPQAPPATSVVIHSMEISRPLDITEVPFPHSSSPIPGIGASPSTDHDSREDDNDGDMGVPCFHKLSFPFDGKDDPPGWLNRCDHFSRAQHTREADKVWLASFHMTGAAQHWYYMLERDLGVIQWPEFQRLCQQRFGPAIGTNHMSDLARLPF